MKIKSLTAIVALAFAVPALAGDKQWFANTDSNGDGYLSADELGEKKAKKIQKLDTDGDQQISRAEYDEYKARKYGQKKDEA
ncbi:MAG: hypothetical protein AB8G17_03130 [Gammaproteobacteria bacterium]